MQIATLNYPKDQYSMNSKSKYPSRHILTTVIKAKSHENLTTKYNQSLPSIKLTRKPQNSICIHGNGFQGTTFNDSSLPSFHQTSRSHSRRSNRSDHLGGRSRSLSPIGESRSSSKLVRLKFGYPIKVRSKDFYRSDLTQSELHARENSFINDSIRTSTENIHKKKVTHYDPLNDPHLSEYFQSPVVLKVVHKTLNINEFNRRLIQTKKRSKSHEADPTIRKIVAKHSSGYGKLNGYDCIPPFASTRFRRLLNHDRYQSSANSSLASFPTSISTQSQSKKPSKRLPAMATSSPIRHTTAFTHDTEPISSIS